MGEESVHRERDDFFFLYFLFLSHIYENRTVDFRRSRRKSWSMRQELRVGTKSLAFRPTLKDKEFSYFSYF